MGVGRGRAAHTDGPRPNTPPPSGVRPRQEFIRDAIESWHMKGVTFLEIGYCAGDVRRTMSDVFAAHEVNHTAVDILEEHRGPEWYICMDSCEFWRTLPVDIKYHVIFVDGCHCEGHADVDVKGAVVHLHLGGTLLIHDTGPSNELDTLRVYGGPARAYMRNCLGRPEFAGCVDPRHGEGMAVLVKKAECGRKFLTETYEKGLHYGCDLYKIGEECEAVLSIENLFPLYFPKDHGKKTRTRQRRSR